MQFRGRRWASRADPFDCDSALLARHQRTECMPWEDTIARDYSLEYKKPNYATHSPQWSWRRCPDRRTAWRHNQFYPPTRGRRVCNGTTDPLSRHSTLYWLSRSWAPRHWWRCCWWHWSRSKGSCPAPVYAAWVAPSSSPARRTVAAARS